MHAAAAAADTFGPRSAAIIGWGRKWCSSCVSAVATTVARLVFMVPQQSTPLVVRHSRARGNRKPLKTAGLNLEYGNLSGGIASTGLTMTLDGTRTMKWVACALNSRVFA